MADTQIKPEIKLDPAESTANMADLDAFEDDHDLHIPPMPPEGPQAWLVKVPKYIWNAWSDIYRNAPDDGMVEIGKMRVYNNKPGEGDDKQRTQIRLNPGVPQHVELPKVYNLDIKSSGYSNTAVFSEKDLPGHKPFGSVRGKSPANQLKPRGIPIKSERYGASGGNKYRTAIPKQTALAPLIWHVADAAPEQDASYYDHFEKMYQASTKPKKTTTFHAGIDRNLHPGASHLSTFSSFGLSSRPGARKKIPPKEKAVRISHDDLLDRIYQCFRRYKYWSLKALRNELKQPETWIKQTLEEVATLIRSGDFAMNYMIKPELVKTVENSEMIEDTAVVKSEAEESEMEMDVLGSDDDGDGEDLFEDVNMGGDDAG